MALRQVREDAQMQTLSRQPSSAFLDYVILLWQKTIILNKRPSVSLNRFLLFCIKKRKFPFNDSLALTVFVDSYCSV